MQRAEALTQAGIDVATSIARGLPYEHALVTAVVDHVGVDAGAWLISWDTTRWDSTAAVEVITVPEYAQSPGTLADAMSAIADHPFLAPGMHGRPAATAVVRLSDRIALREFWKTDTWAKVHGSNHGRYPAYIPLFAECGIIRFIGLQRAKVDFTAAEVADLEALRCPIQAALTYRFHLDQAKARLHGLSGGTAEVGADSLTAREIEVIALVATGRTNRQVGRSLGITERTVRKHLDDARGRIGAPNRAAAAAWWQQRVAG